MTTFDFYVPWFQDQDSPDSINNDQVSRRFHKQHNANNISNDVPSPKIWLLRFFYAQHPMMITIFWLLTHNAPNAYHDGVMFWLSLYSEPNTSFLVHMTCIDQGKVLNDRWLYSMTIVLYHALEKTHCYQPNGPSLTAIAKYLQDAMDKQCHVLRFTPQLESKSNNLYLFFWLNQLQSTPIHLFACHNRQLYHNVQAMSENSYPTILLEQLPL